MAGMPTNVLDAGGCRVARCDFDGDATHSECAANARLVAAAPDMLAALHAVLAVTQDREGFVRQGPRAFAVVEQLATDAIAKAEGRQP